MGQDERDPLKLVFILWNRPKSSAQTLWAALFEYVFVGGQSALAIRTEPWPFPVVVLPATMGFGSSTLQACLKRLDLV